MSDVVPEAGGRLPFRGITPNQPPVISEETIEALRRIIAGVMAVQDTTIGWQQHTLRVRGRLMVPAEQAFAQIRPQFEALGHTPRLYRDDGMDAIAAIPYVFGREARRVPWGALTFFLLTLLSVFWVGVSNELYIPFAEALSYRLTGTTMGMYPADLLPTAAQFSEAVLKGLLYTAALLGILGAHEMGHFLMARHHGVQTTFPFFIPLPLNILGTMGAVIAMKEPAPNRKIQFDIGVAGPLAGLVVAIPVLVIGLLLSDVSTRAEIVAGMPASIQDQVGFYQEGQSLLYLGIKWLVFGQVLPRGDLDVFIHPVAFAAWAGLLVTALNLLPVGQLDGGHVLYGLFGDKARRARLPIIAALVVLAAVGTLADLRVIDLGFGWSGWWLWVALMVFLLRGHAPVLDEITGLDSPRRLLGVLTLIVFILIFTPQPLVLSAALVGLL